MPERRFVPGGQSRRRLRALGRYALAALGAVGAAFHAFAVPPVQPVPGEPAPGPPPAGPPLTDVERAAWAGITRNLI
ncbi:hypothetical protein SAMN04489727_4390 [Amycolatopsis tolypomycina]|uniref:Uncharacterized protein n=1 Tax=Amycolatopsis tolypomycina TaxID=208445 RepID=A0A1H4TWZ1_9PSEU|nr:hypothetical protein [Amycolatopsis tolypomycina]SEC61043.1 hypothetical protein SAMN04489727_4390 [Amycolatopsis tolypomycina]